MADPKIAFTITIDPAHEGGYQDNPNDRGNWTSGEIGVGELKGTKYGISAHEFPELSIKDLTPDQAIAIYIENYWKDGFSQIDSQDVANKLADLGVLFGVHMAVSVMQGVVGVPMDGLFGPNTLDAINAHDPASVLAKYKEVFVQHALSIGANNPAERPDVGDWVRRINS